MRHESDRPPADVGVAVGIVVAFVASLSITVGTAVDLPNFIGWSLLALVSSLVLLLWRWFRLSRRSGAGFFRSAGRSTKEALKAIVDLPIF